MAELLYYPVALHDVFKRKKRNAVHPGVHKLEGRMDVQPFIVVQSYLLHHVSVDLSCPHSILVDEVLKTLYVSGEFLDNKSLVFHLVADAHITFSREHFLYI